MTQLPRFVLKKTFGGRFAVHYNLQVKRVSAHLSCVTHYSHNETACIASVAHLETVQNGVLQHVKNELDRGKKVLGTLGMDRGNAGNMSDAYLLSATCVARGNRQHQK